jgi:hypothetical protein
MDSIKTRCANKVNSTIDNSIPYISIGLASVCTYCYENMKWPSYIPVQAAAFLFATYHISVIRSFNDLFKREEEENPEHVEPIEPAP